MAVAAPPSVALRWDGRALSVLDQTALPAREVWLDLTGAADTAAAIRRLAVRGAPLIGIVAAYGLAMEIARRPGLGTLEDGAELLADARRILTICNTGALAAGGAGTALAVILERHRRGGARVLACETRPLLQGARLTAWELQRAGVPFELVVDSAAAGLIRRGEADAVIAGCDRVARNGDVANKVGTYGLALAAGAAGIPFVIAGPTSSIDPELPHGDRIVIEERGAEEVVALGGTEIAPPGTAVRNPAFDVTPAELITALVTERGVVAPPTAAGVAELLER
jgi:methylthioribose-1-phosphate isomerase